MRVNQGAFSISNFNHNLDVDDSSYKIGYKKLLHVPMKTFPNEILALVLRDVCELDDDGFEFAHRFIFKPHNTTTRIAALLVCKRWQRVAHSPVYRTIILSTAVQARCLVCTLGDQPNLGIYVRKLLFNGGFGATARRILQATWVFGNWSGKQCVWPCKYERASVLGVYLDNSQLVLHTYCTSAHIIQKWGYGTSSFIRLMNRSRDIVHHASAPPKLFSSNSISRLSCVSWHAEQKQDVKLSVKLLPSILYL